MAYRLVTCPESAHLELIEYADTPCGLLILGCSSFGPPCAVNCPRTCAARLDQHDRVLGDGDVDLVIDLEEYLLAIGDDTSPDVLGRLRERAPSPATKEPWPAL
jgi:hypothetical protein